MPQKPSKFVLSYNNESLLIGFLFRLLSDKTFDFTYKLEEMGGEPIQISNQKLSSEIDNPIRIEERGKVRKWKEEIVLVTDQDDLIISVSAWRKPLKVDLAEKDNGKITITNADGDVYIFQIHC